MWIEVAPHREELGFRPEVIDAVVKAALITLIVAGDTRGLTLRPVRAGCECLRQQERAVETVHRIRSRTRRSDRSVGDHGADRTALQHVALHAHHRKIGRFGLERRVARRADVHEADGVLAQLSGKSSTHVDRHDAAVVEANAPRVEQLRRIGATAAAKCAIAAACEIEDTAAFQEELALLGKKQAEPREVDLLFVGLDLREIGIDREISREIGRDGVLDVAADFTAHAVVDSRRAHAVGGGSGHHVRLELDVLAGFGEIETHQRTASRNAIECLRTGQDTRHGREVVPFIFVPHRTPDLHAPHLIRPRAIAQRLKRNRHLDGPSTIEASGLRRPHRVPVGVGGAFVHNGVVSARAEWIGVERKPTAAIVERVEEHADVFVVAQTTGVASQFVHDPFRGR